MSYQTQSRGREGKAHVHGNTDDTTGTVPGHMQTQFHCIPADSWGKSHTVSHHHDNRTRIHVHGSLLLNQLVYNWSGYALKHLLLLGLLVKHLSEP